MGQASATTATYYFAGGAYEVTAAVPSNTVTSTKKYYSLAGQMVALDDGGGLKYFLQDHLGSVAAVLDANGTLLSEQRYLPFGQPRASTGNITQTDFGYTGQRDLDATGLMDYKARFYDNALGKFIQPDTIVPGAANPQAWNRYSYVLNSPIRYSDPSGHRACDEERGCEGERYKERTNPIDIKIAKQKKKYKNGFQTPPYSSMPGTPEFIGPPASPLNPNPDDFSFENGSDDPDYWEWIIDGAIQLAGYYDQFASIAEKGYKYFRIFSFNPTGEALVSAGLKIVADLDNPLTLGQRIGRGFYAGGEALVVDSASALVMTMFGFPGGAVTAGGADGPLPFADIGGAAVGSVVVLVSANIMFTGISESQVQPWFYKEFGLYDSAGN